MKKYLWFGAFFCLLALIVTSHHEQHPQYAASINGDWQSPSIHPPDIPQAKRSSEKADWHSEGWNLAYLALGWPGGVTVWALFITMIAIAEQSHFTRIAAKATENGAVAAKLSAEAALLNAKALISAERAWLLADLDWFDMLPKNYIMTELAEEGEKCGYTELRVKLICKNEGRSPAWVDSINARMDILTDIRTAPQNDSYHSYGTIEPIGVGRERFTSLELSCDGLIDKPKQFLSITVIIKYHDPFGKHETGLGYSLSHGQLLRQMANKENNWNT